MTWVVMIVSYSIGAGGRDEPAPAAAGPFDPGDDLACWGSWQWPSCPVQDVLLQRRGVGFIEALAQSEAPA
ncbi:hypothetical protein [Cellulomonas hominis]